jgi:hypothetical protein
VLRGDCYEDFAHVARVACRWLRRTPGSTAEGFAGFRLVVEVPS